MPESILVIDDDRDLCRILTNFLGKKQYQTKAADSGAEGLRILEEEKFDLVLCDYRLPDLTGLEMLKKIKGLNPKTPVIIITGYSDVRTAVETFKFGASDYVTKPLYPDELLITIRETISKAKSKNEQVELHEKGKSGNSNPQDDVPYIVGPSPQSISVQKHIQLIAPSDMSVIVEGDTGTGKEFVAQAIHRLSPRANAPFVAIDCGSLPKELAGSELFGHVKGAFTGAIGDKPGSFEVANGGTIFLDEIGNLTYENQIKLLRVIQERKIKKIGDHHDIDIDVRIIVATNEDLITSYKEGRFREDLYHRLNEFKISLVPIRERKDDILAFANFFLSKANASLKKNIVGFSDTVVELFLNYHWYGNLRELSNVVKRAALLTSGQYIEAESLPNEITNPADDTYSCEQNLLKSVSGNAERQVILSTLEQVNFNKSKAAEILNIDRKTLYNKLKLYNIQREKKKASFVLT